MFRAKPVGVMNQSARSADAQLVLPSRRTTSYTDDRMGYQDIGGTIYKHETVKHSASEYANGMAHTNGVESVWSTIKRGFNGVYYNWSKKHCQQYVNEFMFRLNEGNVDRDTQDRLDELFKAMGAKKIMYKDLVS